ncbi:MAG: hypothetical protein H7145_24230 [Akkermansiaceae bacterium]|nr:hypothetical protein [Armatimonadota bacterium]
MRKIQASIAASFLGGMATVAAVTGIAFAALGLANSPANAASPGNVGTKAPALQGSTWSVGKPTSLASLKGKVVLLSFWKRTAIM